MLHFSRKNAIKDARQLFETAGKTRYDYPEFVFDAWTAFEHREGSASDLQRALMVSAREMTFVDRRRRQVSSFPFPQRQQTANKADCITCNRLQKNYSQLSNLRSRCRKRLGTK